MNQHKGDRTTAVAAKQNLDGQNTDPILWVTQMDFSKRDCPKMDYPKLDCP